MADISYVALQYSSIDDKNINVSDSENKKIISKNTKNNSNKRLTAIYNI